MLTLAQKIFIFFIMLISCAVVAICVFAIQWPAMTDDHKSVLVNTGKIIFIFNALFSIAICIWFIFDARRISFTTEMADYNRRMAEQFNVGACISPCTWLDADDYRRLAAGSRK